MANKYIIVNATALDKSGALSILKQFIGNIPENDYKWLIFIPELIPISVSNHNVRLENISGVKPMYKRLWWDAFGVEKWLKKNNINPIASISLQNTGFRVGKKVPSFIYYHQPIPFYHYSWNPFHSTERLLWFYKYIYPFFVKLYLSEDTNVFVQLDFIKKGFTKKFNFPKNKVKVFSPSVNKPQNGKVNLTTDKLNLFYPATGFFYKNHRVLQEAIKVTQKSLRLYLTLPKSESMDKIECLGTIPYEEVCRMYNSCDALLFPSYIETFGLPLIEAAMTGMPIVAADLPYSREVLSGYEGAVFVKHDNPKEWANAIDSLEKSKRYKPLDISQREGWKELFKSIISKL